MSRSVLVRVVLGVVAMVAVVALVISVLTLAEDSGEPGESPRRPRPLAQPWSRRREPPSRPRQNARRPSPRPRPRAPSIRRRPGDSGGLDPAADAGSRNRASVQHALATGSHANGRASATHHPGYPGGHCDAVPFTDAGANA